MITSFSFFHYYSYINILGILPFFCIFFTRRITIDSKLIAIVLLITVYIIYICIYIPINSNNILNVGNFLRYYLGVFFFFFILRDHEINLSLNLLYILIALLFIEFILINFFITASLLPNFPDCLRIWPSNNCPYEYKNILGFQRAHGFGGRPGITVGIILAIACITKFSLKKEFLIMCSVFLTMSGVGIIAYLIYIFINSFNQKKINFYIFIFLFLITCFFMIASGKFALINFSLILKDKFYLYEYLIESISFFPNQIILSDQIINNKYGSDKGLISLFDIFGLSFILLLIFILRREIFNIEIFFPLLIMIITSLHYASIFSVPGQIVTAYLLSYRYKDKMNFKEVSFYKKNKKNIIAILILLLFVISIMINSPYTKVLDLTYGPEMRL